MTDSITEILCSHFGVDLPKEKKEEIQPDKIVRCRYVVDRKITCGEISYDDYQMCERHRRIARARGFIIPGMK
ncbi:MAG: hypothetical protein Solivirus2_15 [Solivirus sp.]|jgi:hypothetical protein|uniref:Uncharacterized protein n=1 Tax=Solivirus sp. TaxID=2487772 RepID=A0A3G5AH77_9VIRU|nr:MAG: hypothetical protein Solivirus2_15 [Solivirus sp.]